MKVYVLGFLFDTDYDSVLLIDKQRSKLGWQVGRMNGVGGHKEDDEGVLEAIVREFEEETGLDTHACNWRQFVKLSGDGFVMHCFTAVSDQVLEFEPYTTDEGTVFRALVEEITAGTLPVIENLRWMVPMAAHDRRFDFFVTQLKRAS